MVESKRIIPFLDLSAATKELREELDAAYHRFMDSGWYVLGQEVEAFEAEYAKYCEAKYCVGVGTGLDALVLALRACQVGPGDEVIVPSNTYIATWLAVTQVGAAIVPAEPDPETHNIDPKNIANLVSDRTKAILPVNLYGQPVDYYAIREIATSASVKVIIDNAQAHGARYQGRRVGGLADVECHSFYPSKNLGAFGEAGAITTNSEAIADRVRTLRNYGSKVRYYNDECGTNSRLDAIQAAFLRVKLKYLDSWNDRRRRLAQSYFDELSETDVVLPVVPDWAEPVWHLFVIQVSNREDLRSHLQANGIGTQVHYPVAPHASVAYQYLALRDIELPVATQLSQRVLSLPMGPHLAVGESKLVANCARDYLGKRTDIEYV